MAYSCVLGNELSGSVKVEEFHDCLNDCHFLKKMLYMLGEPYAIDGTVFEVF
jgi:hypothetical protein